MLEPECVVAAGLFADEGGESRASVLAQTSIAWQKSILSDDCFEVSQSVGFGVLAAVLHGLHPEPELAGPVRCAAVVLDGVAQVPASGSLELWGARPVWAVADECE